MDLELLKLKKQNFQNFVSSFVNAGGKYEPSELFDRVDYLMNLIQFFTDLIDGVENGNIVLNYPELEKCDNPLDVLTEIDELFNQQNS